MNQEPPEEEDTDGKIDNFGRRFHEHDGDYVRSVIARHMLWVISAFCGMVILFTATGCLAASDAKELANSIIAPLIGVFGTVVGFFFGSKQR